MLEAHFSWWKPFTSYNDHRVTYVCVKKLVIEFLVLNRADIARTIFQKEFKNL